MSNYHRNFNSKNFSLYLCMICIVVILLSCTSNPFFSDEEISRKEISGYVTLSDNSSPDSVYVWFEGFNLWTYTNDSGYFSITFSSPESQGLGRGFSGELNIYFYLANYRLDTAIVVFSNGRLSNNQKDINKDGELIKAKELQELLNIETFITPSEVSAGQRYQLKVIVKLKTFRENVIVESFRELYEWPLTGFFRTGLIFESVDKPILNTRFIDSPECFLFPEVLSKEMEQQWVYDFTIDSTEFLPGKYSVFPYLIITQRNMPTQLLKSIGDSTMLDFGLEYLKLPIKRTEGLFEVLATVK